MLWKVAVGLGIPFAELIGAPRSGAVVLRRGDSQVLRSADGKFESRLLVLRSTVYPGVTALVEKLVHRLGVDVDVAFCPERIAEGRAMVELYELRLAARSVHASEPHAPGTHEVLVVLSGVLRLRVAEESYELSAGDCIAFAADRAHAYENPASSEARYHNVIVYER